MDRLTRVSAPAALPITVEEAKLHARIDTDADDALVSTLLGAAVEYAERFLGRRLVDQTWDYYLDAFPKAEIVVPLPPLLSVTGVYYTDGDGNEQTFTSYGVDAAKEPARIYLSVGASWPSPRDTVASVRVRFRTGYVDNSTSPGTGAVPLDIIAAINLIFSTLYENRETVIVGQTPMMMPWGAENLLRMHRVELGMA